MKIHNLIFLFSYIVLAQTTPQQIVQNMGVGINVGNVLSAPYEGNWAAPLTESYIDNIARLRFKHVRIPIRFDNQTTPFSAVNYTSANGAYIGNSTNYSVNTSYLNRIEEVINWCTARDLIAIIDVHGDHWFWESYDVTSPNFREGNDRLAAIDRFKAIWHAIAQKFQNKPDTVLFEIMNEPFFSMNAQEVNTINSLILNIIRQTNPTRNVIVTGGGQNSFQAPMQLSPSFINSDNHLIATFHYYRPFSFTSSASEQYTDNDWGTIDDRASVSNDFNQVYTWSQTNNIPVYLGEFGADNVNGYNYFTNTNGSFGGPDLNSRLAFHQYISEAARERGFAYSVWDAGEKSGKTLYLNSSQNWVKDVRNAVLESNCTPQLFINNANIECNYDYNWKTEFLNGYTGKLNNASVSNSFSNSVSLHLNVTNSLGNTTGVVLSNDIFNIGNLNSGNNYIIRCKAKGELGLNFNFRIKLIVNGTTTYLNSEPFLLTTQYSTYEFPFSIPTNAGQISVQLTCGGSTGNYYFDEFTIDENALQVLDIQPSNLHLSPNPVKDSININKYVGFSLVGIYSISGQKISNYTLDKTVIDVTLVKDGQYFLVLKDASQQTIIVKFLVQK